MATKSRSLWPVLGLAVLTVMSSAAAGQPGHHHDKPAAMRSVVPADAVTTFRGTFDRTSGVLHGLMELEYRNPDDTPLTSLSLALPIGWNFTLDSVLLFGVPVDSFETTQDRTLLHLTSLLPIPPGQAGLFLISLSQTQQSTPGRSGATRFWQNWLPLVVESLGGQFSSTECGDLRTVATRSFVDIEVDSSLRIYSGGELINAKEMHGLLPGDSKLLENIAGFGVAADHQTPYRPIFENGRRRYFLRYESDAGCPLRVGPAARTDRIRLDSLVVDIVQPPACSPLDAHRFSTELLTILETLQARLPLSGVWRLMVHQTDHPFPEMSETALGVNRELRPWRSQRTDLVGAVTRWWSERAFSEARDLEFRDGLTGYLALSTVFELHGPETARLLRHLYDPLVWPKYRRAESKSWQLSCADSLFLGQTPGMFHAAPIRWHALRALLNDVVFFDLLQTLQGQRDVSLDALRAAIADPGKAAANSLLDNWLDAGSGERIGLVSVQGKRDKTTNRWRVEASLARTGSLLLPIEIALITVHSDTVIDTIQPIATATHLTYRSPPLASRPWWVILDPFQKLPDLDRRDNLWRLAAPQKPRLVLPRGPETLGSVIFENH